MSDAIIWFMPGEASALLISPDAIVERLVDDGLDEDWLVVDWPDSEGLVDWLVVDWPVVVDWLDPDWPVMVDEPVVDWPLGVEGEVVD